MSKISSLIATSSLFLAVVLFLATSSHPLIAQNGEKKANKKVTETKKTANEEQTNFMRKKLEASGWILEGLTTENNELIIKGAKALAEMSAGEKWQVHHDVLYKQFSNEFQRSAKSLVDVAEKENYDAAALKWMDTTLKCIECHSFVRGVHLAADSPQR